MRTVLLVDDDDLMVIRILNCFLGDFAPVRFATSGRAALKLAREAKPDLVPAGRPAIARSSVNGADDSFAGTVRAKPVSGPLAAHCGGITL
jgi:DNA-binding NarL/FixJ family response regulator